MIHGTIGVDVSSDHLNLYRLKDGAAQQVANTPEGFAQLQQWLGKMTWLRCVYKPAGQHHLAFERYFAGKTALCKVVPAHARKFAFAKSLAVDAALLAQMGDALDLEPAKDWPKEIHEFLMIRRHRRETLQSRAKKFAEMQKATNPFLIRLAREYIELLDTLIAETDAVLAEMIEQNQP